MTPNHHEIGVGATEGLSLRVSVATLARVLFKQPSDGDLMLALERKATLLNSKTGHVVDVKSQPFGGALRFLDPSVLQREIGDFRFDSEESRAEQDFRIFIRPSDWEGVREFCLGHFRQPKDAVLESDPTRELTEEFYETMGIRLKPDQYTYQAKGIIVEDHPSATENIHAIGYRTVRIYRIFETHILNSTLTSAMLKNSENCSRHHLQELALTNFRKDGFGRANAVLTLSYSEINAFYASVPPDARDQPVVFRSHLLDETVAAALEVNVPKYRRV